MYIPTNRKKSNTRKPQIKPGTYAAKVTAVEPADGYRLGAAIDVTYDVFIAEGAKVHRERFSLEGYSSRTDEIDAILDSIGSDNYEDLVGLDMELEFNYELKRGIRYTNVTAHTLIEGGANDAN